MSYDGQEAGESIDHPRTERTRYKEVDGYCKEKIHLYQLLRDVSIIFAIVPSLFICSFINLLQSIPLCLCILPRNPECSSSNRKINIYVYLLSFFFPFHCSVNLSDYRSNSRLSFPIRVCKYLMSLWLLNG